MRPYVLAIAVLFAFSPLQGDAQSAFHSTQSANLPTTEIYPQGSWLFEISHRFLPAISDGGRALWGLDGPVWNRLGLSYSVTDRAALGLLRSNFEDNLELNAKVGLWQGGGAALAVQAAVMGGVAWSMDPSLVDGAEDNEMQLYAQAIVNLGLGEQVAVGVIPTYLRNPRIRDFEEENAFVLGLHGQWYFSGAASVFAEWVVSEERPDLENDGGTFGLEIETRGHFFKLLVTNLTRMNPTQFLGGTRFDFEPDALRFGFNIQRLLPF